MVSIEDKFELRENKTSHNLFLLFPGTEPSIFNDDLYFNSFWHLKLLKKELYKVEEPTNHQKNEFNGEVKLEKAFIE